MNDKTDLDNILNGKPETAHRKLALSDEIFIGRTTGKHEL